MDAFISHSSSDARLAARIERTLEDHGLEIWLDRSEIRLGQLLRNELQTAIRESRVIILLWSAAAAKSRWVAAEVLTAFHSNRFVIACASDKTALPYFLQSTIYLNLQSLKTGWVDELRRAIREAPSSANDILPRMGSETPQLVETVRQLAEGQLAVTDRIGNDLAAAKKYQAVAARELRAAEKKWRMEAMILNLAGYHRKNAYMLKHWPAIMAGRPPKDPLLDRAEHYFYGSLFVDPNDYSALNGLGSILFYERELDAAEFVIRRAILLAETAGVNYPAAQHDLQLVQTFKARNLN